MSINVDGLPFVARFDHMRSERKRGQKTFVPGPFKKGHPLM